MTSNFMGFAGLLFTLPILIGQWVGILGLGKGDRNMAWCFMMIGICCTTLGTIGTWLYMGLMLTNGFSFLRSYGFTGVFMAASVLTGLGSLLFAVGFAIHGQQASKTQQRIAELEVIAAAQGEELNRQRVSYGTAS